MRERWRRVVTVGIRRITVGHADKENSNMTRSRWLSPIALCLVLAVSSVVQAGEGWKNRSFDDFLVAQGTTSVFVPPVPDYVGSGDANLVTFALVDYAGLANAWIEKETGGRQSLGTRVYGTVKERARPDGRAEVRVKLEARNALSWAFLIADANFDDPLVFLNTPLSFGARAQDVVVKGAEPGLGKASFDITFMNAAPGAPLPDLAQLLLDPQPGQAPLSIKFQSKACGLKPNGASAGLRVRQNCSDDGSGQACTKEIVEILDDKCSGRDD
jgi:hypothetical protein